MAIRAPDGANKKMTMSIFFLLMHVQAPCDGVQIVQIAVLPLFSNPGFGESVAVNVWRLVGL